MIYLDTHVVVWLFAAELKRLPQQAQSLMEKNDLLISPMVALELQYLLETGRIKEKPAKIISSLSSEIGLTICEKPYSTAVMHALSLHWTRDPFDRLICAQASLENSHLITKDAVIRKHYKFAIWD